jgi:hypothetical protein
MRFEFLSVVAISAIAQATPLVHPFADDVISGHEKRQIPGVGGGNFIGGITAAIGM